MGGLEACGASPDGPIFTFAMPGDLAATEDLSRWVSDVAGGLGIGPSLVYALQLCSEELVANAIMHGRPSESDDLNIRVSIRPTPPTLCLIVQDNGRPFDPTSFVASPQPTSVADALAGGRGLTLVRHFSAALCYGRRDGWNRTRLVFSNPSTPQAITP